MKIKLIAFIIPLLLSLNLDSKAQSIENINARLDGSKIIVTYDLKAEDNNDKFNIKLFSSHDDFSSTMLLVKGDVGKGVSPGKGKQIEWNARAEIRNYQGAIVVELRGELVQPLFAFENPNASSSFRRGKVAPISWKGGSDNMKPDLAVYKAGEKVLSLGKQANTGLYPWSIPADIKKGKDYTLRLEYGGESIESEPFAIKSKIPLAVKALVVPIAGGIGYLVYSLIANQELPEPPNTPNGN